jgi:L,D-transpeptidase ErfK/SrfK
MPKLSIQILPKTLPRATRSSRIIAFVALGLLFNPVGATAAPSTPPSYPNVIGEIRHYVPTRDDTLLDVARRFGLGFTELVAANPGVDPWLPGKGVRLTLPSAHILPRGPRDGVVLNLADQRLYIFRPKTGAVVSVPVGVGRDAWNTPIGSTKIVRKKANPAWHPPKSIRLKDPTLPRVVSAGPQNPLNRFSVYLGLSGYLFHGTNKPMGVGRRVSHGCVRLYPEDIKRLFKTFAIGTRITLIDEPMKIAWFGNQLLLKIHPSKSQADDIEAGNRITPEKPMEFEYRILDAAGAQAYRLDWTLINRALRQRARLPINFLRPIRTAAAPES